MALSLGVREHDRITIGDSMVRVVSISGPNIIGISVNGGDVIYVSDTEKIEILPEVWVFCGRSDNQKFEKYSRLAFEAPRSIRIERIKY